MVKLLAILLCSSTGYRPVNLVEKAKIEGVEHPLGELRGLIEQDLVRIDKEPILRVKATKKAFMQS